MKNWVDLIIAIALASAFIRGWRAGFLSSIFSAIGFIGGGIGGLVGGLALTKSWHQSAGTFAAILALISFGSWIGELIMRQCGRFFHGKVLFGPFKWLDTLLGAAFSLARTLVMIFLVGSLLLAMPWGWSQKDVGGSYLFKEIKTHAPKVKINLHSLTSLNPLG